VYGYELRKTLAAEGEGVQLSYLYKTLKEMSEEGLLESRAEAGRGGPRRREYRLSAKGERELGQIFDEATDLIHGMYEDYVTGLPPEFFGERFRQMITEVSTDRDDLAMVISASLTPLHRQILDGACRRGGAKRTYLVKPPNVEVDADIPKLNVLDGTFDDIPLKDESLDGMIAVDVQDATNLPRTMREFRRVLRAGGVIFACSPFMGLGGVKDPLEVGEFMKQMRCKWTGRPYLSKEAIRDAFAGTFDYVDIGNLGFLTGFISGLKPIRVSGRFHAT